MDIEVKISDDTGTNPWSVRKPTAEPGFPQTIESTVDCLERVRKHVDEYLTKIIDGGSHASLKEDDRPRSDSFVDKGASVPLPAGVNVDHGKLSYGERSPLQHIEYWRSPNSKNSMLAFVHGGYWQEVEHSFNGNAIASFLSQGVVFSMVHYPAIAGYPLDGQIESVAAAAKVLDELCQSLGIATLALMGHSAGAQLICMSLEQYRPKCLGCVILLSGVYDLRPLVDTYIGRPIGLTGDIADQCSPVLHEKVLAVLRRLPYILLVVGGQESAVFRENTALMAKLVRERQSLTEVSCLTMMDFDHFSLVQSLQHCDAELRLAITRVLARLLDCDVTKKEFSAD